MVRSKIIAILLILTVAVSLFGCSGTKTDETKSSSKDDIIKNAQSCLKIGNRFSNLLMDETSSYFYGYAAAEVSSFRLAVEKLLWLKGEGDSFADLAADSRYTDWDTIAEMCFASPYPYYFEGLIHDVQGESEEANKMYVNAAIMTNYPEEGLNYNYLRGMSVDELYALRDELRKEEDKIYEKYEPEFYGYPRSVYNCASEYLYADAMEKLDAEQYEEAMIPARYAVRLNPKSEDMWVCAVTAAMYADQPHQATVWLYEASKYFPEGEKIGVLIKAINDISEEADAQ
jgi:hypothetical protein